MKHNYLNLTSLIVIADRIAEASENMTVQSFVAVPVKPRNPLPSL